MVWMSSKLQFLKVKKGGVGREKDGESRGVGEGGREGGRVGGRDSEREGGKEGGREEERETFWRGGAPYMPPADRRSSIIEPGRPFGFQIHISNQ